MNCSRHRVLASLAPSAGLLANSIAVPHIRGSTSEGGANVIPSFFGSAAGGDFATGALASGAAATIVAGFSDIFGSLTFWTTGAISGGDSGRAARLWTMHAATMAPTSSN